MNRPVPAGANDLSQSLRVVLIRLIDLHLEGGARMPGIETNDFEPEIAEFMHEPRRHRSGLDPYSNIISRMPMHHTADLFWNRGALTPPQSAAAVRITGRHCPDRGTIGGSRADRDYRMSTPSHWPRIGDFRADLARR
jgi:hypothetical protein